MNKLVLTLLLFNGISICFAGLALMLDPSGRWIGLSLSQLRFLPFTNYFIPGLMLFLTVGLTSLFTAYCLVKQSSQIPNFLILQGSVSLVWVIVQSYTIPNTLFQWIYGVVALALILSGIMGKIKVHPDDSFSA